jgi:hypothetical protein
MRYNARRLLSGRGGTREGGSATATGKSIVTISKCIALWNNLALVGSNYTGTLNNGVTIDIMGAVNYLRQQ